MKPISLNTRFSATIPQHTHKPVVAKQLASQPRFSSVGERRRFLTGSLLSGFGLFPLLRGQQAQAATTTAVAAPVLNTEAHRQPTNITTTFDTFQFVDANNHWGVQTRAGITSRRDLPDFWEEVGQQGAALLHDNLTNVMDFPFQIQTDVGPLPARLVTQLQLHPTEVIPAQVWFEDGITTDAEKTAAVNTLVTDALLPQIQTKLAELGETPPRPDLSEQTPSGNELLFGFPFADEAAHTYQRLRSTGDAPEIFMAQSGSPFYPDSLADRPLYGDLGDVTLGGKPFHVVVNNYELQIKALDRYHTIAKQQVLGGHDLRSEFIQNQAKATLA